MNAKKIIDRITTSEEETISGTSLKYKTIRIYLERSGDSESLDILEKYLKNGVDQASNYLFYLAKGLEDKGVCHDQ